MTDAERRQALADRLTVRGALVVPNDQTDRLAALDATTASVETFAWGVGETRALSRATADDRALLTGYAAYLGRQDELWPALEAPAADVHLTPEQTIVFNRACIEALREQRVRAIVALAERFVESAPDAPVSHGASVATAPEPPEEGPQPELADASDAVFEPAKHRRRGTTRFTYWHDDRLNPDMRPLSDAASAHLAEDYGTYRDNPGAIWAYLAADLRALRAPWVIAQFEAWAAQGEVAQLERAIRWWANRHGKPDPQELLLLIRRDQWIYAHLVRLRRHMRRSQALRRVGALLAARRESTSEENMSLVWREYEREYERWRAERPHLPNSKPAFMRALRRMWRAYAAEIVVNERPPL